MAPPNSIHAKEAIKSPVPQLRIGLRHTSSNAIHLLDFVGDLAPWHAFTTNAWTFNREKNWDAHQSTLGHRPKGEMPLYGGIEHVVVGDETGVQGRFAENVGQVLTQVCRAFGLDLSFGDYKATTDWSVDGVPDSVCMTSARALRILGEVKTPWVKSHRFYSVVMPMSGRFRRQLGKH